MRKFSLKNTLVCIFLLSAVILSGCKKDETVDTDTDTSGTEDTSQDTVQVNESFVPLFGGEEEYVMLKTDSDGKYSDIIQNFVTSLRTMVGKKEIFAGSNYKTENAKEILIGNVSARKESVDVMKALPIDAYSIGFVGEKLVISAHTEEKLQSALYAFIDGLYQAESGEWGVDKSFSVYEDANEIKVDIPAFDTADGRLSGVYISNEDRNQMAYKDATLEEYTAYNDKLKSAGYTVYSENQIGENRYATYVNDTTEIHLMWYPSLENFRIVFAPKGYLPATTVPQYDKLGDCTLTQIGRYGASRSAAGESYVVQLEDGSFVVIDGGPYDERDVENLLQYMNDNKPASHAKPKVTWMITHLHNDHTALAVNFLNRKYNDIELVALCYNFPDTDIYLKDSGCAAVSDVSGVLKKYPNAEKYVFHSGQTMKLPGCEIEFLYTQEDHWPNNFSTANDTSAVWRMKFEGGDFLVLGDSESTPCKQITTIYGDYLRSDILQLSHHGLNGATLEIYQAIDPKICFWPIDEERFSTDEKCLGTKTGFEFNKYLRETQWTRDTVTGDRTHYSASRTVTFNMKDMSVTTGPWLSE